MKRILFIAFFLCANFWSIAAKISGQITDEKGNPLPYSSIFIKGTTIGTTANIDGKYMLQLSPGTYTVICQHVGYGKKEKQVILNEESQILNFQLSVQELMLSEIVLVKGEDPANEIIRQAIQNRKFYNEQVDSFTVDVYIKGLLRSGEMPKKVLGQKIDRSDFARDGLDTTGKGILFLSESMTKVSVASQNKIKYEVIASRQSGGGIGLSFPFFINFYENNVNIFNNVLNQRGFISPIADGAFNYYRYKFIGNFFEEGKMINRIQVFPKRKNEPLFSGFIEIMEDDWRIFSLDFQTTNQYALELLDSFRISQIHIPVLKDIWRVKDQVVTVVAKKMGFDINGNFINIYSNYNLAPSFNSKKFDKIFLKYDSAYNKKDSVYWNEIRPIPLEKNESQNFVFRDSISKFERDSLSSQRHIDSLKANQKSMTIKGIFWKGDDHKFYSAKRTVTYFIEPLLKGLEYNTVEGGVINLDQRVTINNKKSFYNYEINWGNRFGTSNHHYNSILDFTFQKRGMNFRNRYLKFSAGKRVSQFNPENPVGVNSNTRKTLVERENYLKIYENWMGKVEYNNVFENGLRWNMQATFEDRIALANSTDYSIIKSSVQFTPNHPYELSAIPFTNHQAFLLQFTFNYQPGQRFIQYPRTKIPIGSKMPKLELIYTKGVNKIFGSDVNFDKWKLSVTDEMNFKLGGEFRYKISIGGFLNSKQVPIPDMQHINGGQSKIIRKYLNSFWLAPYYRYSNIENFFAISHVEHHFNGLLTNKIPLVNKLKLNLVLGSNIFYGSKNNYYTDAFVGFENIFKVLRIDFVTAWQSNFPNSNGIKLGFGGLLGKNLSTSRRSARLSF